MPPRSEDYNREDLLRMRRDLRADIEQLNLDLAWVEEELVRYPTKLKRDGRVRRSFSLEYIRDIVRGYPQGLTVAKLADLLEMSQGQARKKLDQLVERGTLVRVERERALGGAVYRWEKPDPDGPTRPRPAPGRQRPPAGASGSEPVPRTGRNNPAVMWRQGRLPKR